MPAYVVLYRFTDQGRKALKGTVQRADEIRRQNEARGFKIIAQYWTQGRFDIVTIIEAPDEKAMMAGLFNIAEAGNVTSETLRAFDAPEMAAMLGQG